MHNNIILIQILKEIQNDLLKNAVTEYNYESGSEFEYDVDGEFLKVEDVENYFKNKIKTLENQ